MKYRFTKTLLLACIIGNCSPAFNQANNKATIVSGEKINSAIERFSQSIRFPTVSPKNTANTNFDAFVEFINFLQYSYPLVHQQLGRKIISNYSLLYTWQGKDTTLQPVLFLGHYDVVPVDSNTLSLWKHEPFSGMIDSSHIWGRGAVDDKFQVIAMLEAVEQLLGEGFAPDRSIVFALGHDEEKGGENGALQISRYLQSQNMHFEMILDEGGGVTERLYPGIKKPIAFIATAEKGYMNVELSIQAKGGHTSAPPGETAITIMADAITKINGHPMPLRLVNPVDEMLEALKPYCSSKTKVALNNQWLFKKKILKKLSANEIFNALARTVITPTIINGGVKENSLPSFVVANLNVRMLPGDSAESIMQYLQKTIDDDRVITRIIPPSQNPSIITSSSCASYQLLQKLVSSYFPDAIVTPVLSIVTTDTRHYSCLSRNILRFVPVILENENKEMVHGYNERLSIGNFMLGIRFYYDLMKETNKKSWVL